MTKQQPEKTCWHFQCPECGIGDAEFDEPASAEQYYCEVCLSEDGRFVRLRRWIAVGEPASQ
jgi:hypothetical protein